eukprot:6468495-Amphidinium_carterae.2
MEYWMNWWRFAVSRDHVRKSEREDPREIQIRALDSRKEVKPRVASVWTDSKGLHDALHKEGYSKVEKKTALECVVIQDTLRVMEGECRWLPHTHNIADALTKLHGHGELLQQVIEEGRITLKAEEEMMNERANEREALGYNKRPKRSGIAAEAVPEH